VQRTSKEKAAQKPIKTGPTEQTREIWSQVNTLYLGSWQSASHGCGTNARGRHSLPYTHRPLGLRLKRSCKTGKMGHFTLNSPI